MSGGVCAVMLVKDEADVVETTIRHLLWHVDEVIVADNMSTDGTGEILWELRHELHPRLSVQADEEIGYYQDRKTTALAMAALARGHRWVIPCDADEIWHPGDPDRRIGDFLGGLGPDVMIVKAPVFNHLVTDADPWEDTNPITKIRWRQRFPGMEKVACRLREDLFIQMGNHGATYQGGCGATAGGLSIRHFSWRSEDQFLRKIVNGRAAYAATTLHPMYGAGWRAYADSTDEQIRASFHNAFTRANPELDQELIYDPAPVKR